MLGKCSTPSLNKILNDIFNCIPKQAESIGLDQEKEGIHRAIEGSESHPGAEAGLGTAPLDGETMLKPLGTCGSRL
jgi:hypothetical protein